MTSRRPVAYISIGNTDNKLTQQRWASFCTFTRAAVLRTANQPGGDILFEGYSTPDAPWQNACWALGLPYGQEDVAALKRELADIAHHFDQDSIAYALAPVTEFLGHPQVADAA